MSDVWGIDFDQVESKRGGILPQGHYTFEVDKCIKDINANNKPYVGVWCKVVRADDESLIGRVWYDNKYLSEKAIAFTKGFFEDIGAAHCLHPTKSPADAEGTVFEADVKHRISKGPDGTTQEEAQLVNIEPMDGGVDDDEEPEGEEPEEEEEKKSSPKTTATKSRRRR